MPAFQDSKHQIIFRWLQCSLDLAVFHQRSLWLICSTLRVALCSALLFILTEHSFQEMLLACTSSQLLRFLLPHASSNPSPLAAVVSSLLLCAPAPLSLFIKVFNSASCQNLVSGQSLEPHTKGDCDICLRNRKGLAKMLKQGHLEQVA